MDTKDTNNKNKKIIVTIFVCVFLALEFLSWCTPLAGDDYIYAFNDNSVVRPIKIIDIIRNIRIQRVTTSARFISHFFVEYFIMRGKWIFNIVNAAINTAALYILYSLVSEQNNSKKNIYLLISAIFLIWTVMPVFGEVYLWLDGACNYSWAAALMLLFIYPFVKEYICLDFTFSLAGKTIWVILCAVFGAYSENGSAAGLIVAFILMIMILIEKKKKDYRMKNYLIVGFVFGTIGYAFLISSPVILDKGNLSGNPISGILEKITILISNIIDKIGLQLILIGFASVVGFIILIVIVLKKRKGLIYLISIILLIWAGLSIFFALRAINSAKFPESGNIAKAALASEGLIKGILLALISEPIENMMAASVVFSVILLSGIYFRVNQKKIICSIVFAIAGFASIAVFLLAIYQPARSCCYYIILLTAGDLIIISELEKRVNHRIINSVGIVLSVVFIVFLITGVQDNISVKKQDNLILKKISVAKMNGDERIELNPYEYSSKYSALYGIDNIATEYCWLNHYMGMYYGFNELIGIK